MNDNIQKLYGALQKYGYNDLGTAEEFGAKVQDDSSRRKLYDAMSRDGFDDLGTYEEFSGKLVQNAKPQPVQATEPVKSESQKRTDRFNAMVRRHEEANGHVPGEEDEATEAWAKEFVANRGMAGYERRKQERHDELSQMVEDRKANEAAQKMAAREQKAFEASEGLEMFNEMREKKGIKNAVERAAEYMEGKGEPLGANVEGMSAEELDKVRHSMVIEKSFTEEYERRKAEYAEHMKEFSNVRGDVRDKDFGKYDEERKWLQENERRYNDMKGRLDNVQSRYLELTTPDAMADLDEAQKANRDQMASTSEVIASGYTTFGGSNIGSSEEAKENAIRTKADEIYNMARQTLNQGSKYDKGYEGNGMEQAATAIRQFIQGGINNVDKGSLTMGLSEGMALWEARRVGDKYNGIITDTIKDLGYSDRDVTRMMGDLEKKTKELEPVAQELERSRSEIEVMQSTLDEMIANGEDQGKIRDYAKELNKQISSYNKKIKDSESLFADYKKTRDQYDEVTSAVEAAIQSGLTGGEQAVLDALQQYTKAQYLRSNDVSKAAAAGAGFEDTLEFMLGFILTGGLEKAGTKAATALTRRHLEKKLGKRVGTDLVEAGMKKLSAMGPIKSGLGYQALTDLGVAAVRTVALPTRNIQTYGEQLAEYADVDKLGRLQFNRSKLNAAANTLFTNFVENWSEGFGTYLSAGEQKLFRLATGNAPKVAIGKTLQNYRGSIGNYLDHGKFDGLFNEMMEEVGGSGLNWFAGWLSSGYNKLTGEDGPGIGDKEALSQFFAGEQLATTFLSFLPLSAIGAATNISAYNKMARRYDESVAKLNPLIESGALDAEKLDKIVNEISGMTPERATKRIIELGEETREKNHGELPEDFAPAVMGYIQGKYAMDLRHDEWEESREKMEVVQAYASAYEKPDLRNAWDSRQAEQETRAAAVEAGFTDEELDRNAYVLAQDAASIRETDPERSQVLSNYANAKSARAGLVDSYRDAGRKAEEEFDAAVRQNLSRDGIVISAQIQENGQPKTVYITTKGVKINNDGTVSTPTGVDGPILYRDSATGEQKKVMASQLSGAEISETDDFIRRANEADADVRARAFEAAENTVSMAGRVRAISANIGNNVVVRRNGVYAPVKIERMTNGGLGVVISGDKKALQGIAAAMGMQVPASQYLEAPVARFYNLLSKEQDGSLTTFNEEQGQAPAQAQVQGAPALAAEEVPEVEIKPNDKFTVNYKGRPREVDIDQANDTEVWFSYTDENGNEATGVMTPYDFRESIVTEGTPVQEAAPAAAPAAQAPAPAPAQSAFPVDENGNRIYDDPSVSPQAAYDEIYNGVEAGSKNEANRNKFVAAKAAKAAKEVEDVENMIAGLQAKKAMVDEWDINDGEELDAFEQRKAAKKRDFDRKIAELEAGLPELQRKAAHWNGVQTLASQRTQPAPAQAAPAPAPAAQKRKPRMSKKARVARAKQWEERTGVKVKIAMTPKEVTDKDAREELEKGGIVYGWYDNDTHTVGLYLPYLTDEEEVDKTFIHEVISHRGLRALLGDEEYNKLLDRVWNELMSEQEQKDWLAYNEHLKGHSEEFLRRAAADEFIANLSEDLDVADHRTAFEKFVDWVKDLFNRVVPRTSEQIAAEAAGIAAKENISRDDLFTLLRDSLSNYEAVLRAEKKRAEAKPLTTESLPENIQEGLKEQGKVMDGGTVMDEQQAALKEATGYKTPNEKDMASNSVVGDVRMSKETMPAWKRNYMTYPEAKEHVVKVLENLMERMSADQLVNNVVPGGVYKYGEKTSGSKAGPLRTNIEYIVTFDMDTSCPRSLQYLEYVKKIEAQIGRPLTQTEMIQLIEMMRVYGQMIPCVYCYCENKRQALKQYYHDYMTARQGVINAKTEEDALAAMYGHETTKAARESKDPKVALTEAAYKVFTRWRSGDVKYNPSLKQLWQQYRNDRNVILTVLDQLLDNKKITTFMTDETIAGHLCKDLRIEDKLAKKAAEDLVGEWKWNRIENRPHDDFKRIEDEDDLVVGQETLALWREMTAYGKSASQAKNVLRYVPYTDELKTLSQKDRDYINGMGGLRMHSSNDFRIDYVLDYFQFMADMAVNHMYGHTYTKSPEFVRIFGNSGYKINMSIAAVEDANGIHPNSQEGFDWDEARELREKFPNAGVMLMATSDAQVQMALDSDWIDMFIPFHASGLPKAVWYDMRQWTDYSSIQNERFLNGDEMKAALAEDGVVVPKGTSAEEVEQMYIDHFNIHVARYTTGKKAGKRISPHFLPGKTIVDGVEIPGHNNDYETYIRLCREWGVHPRFYGLKVKDNTPEGGGREVDITEHPAYMKCIKETARTDTPQTAIEFNFDQPSEALGGKTPIDYALEELKNRAAAEAQAAGGPVRNIYESYKQDPYGIVPQFINTIIKHKETTGKDYPLDYLTPDSRKWAMEERKALEEAYKEFDTIPYHPHVYDADGNLIMEPETEAQQEVESDGSYTMLRKVTDPAVIDWFNNATKTTGFRTVAKKAEDTFGSPMAGQLGQTKGKGRVATSSFNMNEIEQSEENPDIADENGKVKLIKPKRDDGKKLTDVGSVDYNPYIHLRLDKINRQFKDAWKRDDLVYIESEVPVEEVPDFRGQKEPDYSKSPYHAEKAALPVGIHDWNGGALMLSRYDRPIREVPWEEVADAWAADKDFQKNGVHFDIVPPQMRDLLTERGIKIIEPHKGMGQDCIDAYNAWKNRDNGPDGGTRFRKANQAQLGLVSNAGAALDRIKMEKATPEQWVKMLEKEGGLKAGEDKWLGLSDWLKSQDKKSLTKDEIDDYIAEHRIVLAEVAYTDEDPAQLIGRKDPEAAEAFEYTESSWDERAIADIKDTAKAVALYNRDNPDDQVTAGPNGEMTPEDRDKILEYAEDRYSAQADVNRINSIRLGYTTEGLSNKREIALVVPTIESWNESDNIHFGDAGNGRAVAWVRFGETTAPAEGETDANKDHAEAIDSVDAFEDRMKEKYGENWYNKISAEERDEERRLLNSLDDAFERAVAQEKYGNRVLVIDEIQSKRHQEAREQGGYKDDTLIKRAEAKMDAAKDEYDNYVQGLVEKYGGFNEMRGKLTPEENAESQRLYSVYQNARTVFNRNGFDPNEDEEYRRLRAEQQAHEDSPEFQQLMKDWTAAMKAGDTDRVAEIQTRLNPFQLENQRLIHKIEDREVELADEFNETHKSKVAAAPFEKNWHELAMKRMLRLAAEEGYDYVAWTTGNQQAERYNIGGKVDWIQRGNDFGQFPESVFIKMGDKVNSVEVDENGTIVDSTSALSDTVGKPLSDLLGKELAEKVMSATPGKEGRMDGEDLRVGGEGMKGFYDDILPRFMNKYGKKWGVKVQDIELPYVEDAGRVMHAVPVTQEMKDSVMEGQTMFRKAPNGKQSNLTDEQWEMVRTPEFKAWFGDWENDPANASKVVDENGEPMVVYHGTRWDPMSEEPGNAVFKSGWFTGIKQRADGYGEPVSVFLNIKNPIPEDVASNFPGLDLNDPSTFGDYDGYISYIDYGENRELSPIAVRRLKAFYPDRYEQLIEEETAKLPTGRKMFSIIPRDPSQIKSATDNNGEFDPNNPDIRFRKSTVTPEQDKEYMDAVNSGDMEKARQMVDDAAKAAGYTIRAFHGTPTENGEMPFTVFESGHFTDDHEFAEYFGNAGGYGYVYDTYLKMENPLVYDFKGQNSDDAIDENGNTISTWTIIDRARESGNYDGVIIENVDEYGNGIEKDESSVYGEYPGAITDYIPLSPSQVKSADPVTRDDNGNVIPLSERFNEENNDIRFRKALDPETAELFDAAKERFGTTRDLREAGYILPDGTMLDFSGRHWTDPNSDNSWLNGHREVDHRDISDIEYERDGNTPTGLKTDMSDFIRRGAIRINYPGSINLATKPTWDQVDALERLIRMDNRFVRVDFGDGSRSDHYADYDYASPAKIIDDIYGYFDDGVKPQGTSGTFFRKATIEEQRIADAGREATVQAFGTMPAVIKSGVNGISRDRMPDGHKTDKGYYNPDDNNVYVCMDNVADERDAVATVIHETVGYKGLQELLGNRFNDMMTGVYAALDNAGRTWVNAYIARNGLRPGDAAVVRGMEEYLARTAERDGGDSLENVNEVLSKIVGDLFGVADFEFTDRELAYILRASYEHSVNPGWLDTPVGRAKDTLMKRELGINETDPNKPTDPDGGTRFRKSSTGTAAEQYKQDLGLWYNKMITENQNADLPVKIGMQRAMQEVFGDNWEEKMRSLPESQDYLMRHNVASSRAATEYFEYMLSRYEPMTEKVKEIEKLIAGEGAKRKALLDAYQRVRDYMYAVSGLERNEWERANGGEQKDWSGITSLMGYKDKDQWQQAEADARKMIDQFRKDLMNAVRKDGQTEAEAYADADATLNELWALVQSCTDYSLDHAYKYGLLTRDEYERLRGTASKPRMWNYYLPLRGFNEKTAEDLFGYASLSGNGGGEVVEHAKGRWTEADNPLANILNIAQREIVNGNENWARQALLNFTVNLGKNSLLSERNPWYVKDDATGKWKLAYPEPEVDPTTNEQTGTQSIEEFEAAMKAKQAKGEARQGRRGLKIDQIMANKGHRNQHLVHVKIGGSDRMIWVNGDPAMAKAISGYGRRERGEIEKAVRDASRVLSNLFTTYSLDFTAKNLIRDTTYAITALHMKEDKAYRHRFAKNWIKNFGYGAFAFPMIKLAAEWDSGKLQQKQNPTEREKAFMEFMRDGGQTGYTVVRSVEKLKKDLEKTMAPRLPKRFVDWAKVDVNGVEVPIIGIFSWGVRTLNEAFELLTRFTTYQTSRDMGRTGQRAAYDAKEISVNFNRKGAQTGEGLWGQLASYLGATHYFYNAGVQGFDNFLRLYKTAPVKMGATSVAILGMGLLMPFINSMLAGIGSGGDDGGDDEWYWNLPEWVRRNNIIIGWKSTKKDEDGKKRVVGASYFALPLPVEFRAIYGLGDIAASAFAYQKMPNRTFGRVAGDILSTTAAILPFNPIENYTAGGNVADAAIRAVAPDIMMPFVDVATNRDYTGRALMKENPFTHVVPKNQGAYASTPKALVDACQWIGETAGLDLAPGVVRDVLNNYAGGYYRFAEDMAKQFFTDIDHPRRWDDIPFLSGFTGHIDEDRTNTYVNGVLNEYKRVSQKTVLRMNLFNSSDDITEKIAYETPELLPDKARVQRILSGKSYELGKMYYFGMKDKGTGEYHKVEKIHKSGKSAGKRYSVKEEIKIPGVETLKKRWKDAREYWATLPKGSPEAAEAYKDVTNAWHEYYNAQANLAEKLMNYEYGK